VKKQVLIQTHLLESFWAKIIGMAKTMGTGDTNRRVIRLTGVFFRLFSLCIFFQLIQLTNPLNKIQFMPNINVLHVWAQGCHSQGFLHFQVIQAHIANLVMYLWRD